VTRGDYKLGRLRFAALIDNLESAVQGLQWQAGGTEWANYYENTNYSPQAHEQKKALVAAFLDQIKPNAVLDLGANTGVFSRLASERGILTLSCDIDPAAVEQNYLTSLKKGESCLLPLILDLTNPSPGIGWENQERGTIFERAPVDTAMALALIHHLAISNNLPLHKIAHFFSHICRSLIIEFVPKQDSQVQRLLSTREDIFFDYTQAAFEREFKEYFAIQQVVKLDGSERTLYLMQKEQPL
jgi:ribosomal protein L11 methylase PrmA